MPRQCFIFDDGQEIFGDSITAKALDSGDATKVNFGLGGSIADYVYTAANANAAQTVLSFVNQMIQSGRTGYLTVPNPVGTAVTSSTWVSISPSSISLASSGGFYSCVVNGASIADITGLGLQLDDGSGHVITLSLSATSSGDNVYADNFGPGPLFTITGTYTLYWNAGGGSFATTGLSVTVSA